MTVHVREAVVADWPLVFRHPEHGFLGLLDLTGH